MPPTTRSRTLQWLYRYDVDAANCLSFIVLAPEKVTAWHNNKWTSIHGSLHDCCRPAMGIFEVFAFVRLLIWASATIADI